MKPKLNLIIKSEIEKKEKIKKKKIKIKDFKKIITYIIFVTTKRNFKLN